MQTPNDLIDQLDNALNPEPAPRRRTPPKIKAPIMTDALTEARARLINADQVLTALEGESTTLDAQSAAEREKVEADRRTLDQTHEAMREKGLDFALQLRIRRDNEDMAERFAAIERAIYEQRAQMDQRLIAAKKAVVAAEAAVAQEILLQREAEYMHRAEAAAEALWEARRAAWTVYQKLGRVNAPDALRAGLFSTRVIRHLPTFTPHGASSTGYLHWAAVAERDVTQTLGIAEELRS